MSISASIDLRCKNSCIEILEYLIEVGWRLKNKNNKTEILPLGDNGDYDWEENNLSKEEILILLHKKEKRGETIGIVLYWKNTDIGITLLAYNTKEVSLLLNINRIKMKPDDPYAITDVNWYLERTVMKLKVLNCHVEGFTFTEM